MTKSNWTVDINNYHRMIRAWKRIEFLSIENIHVSQHVNWSFNRTNHKFTTKLFNINSLLQKDVNESCAKNVV